MSPAARSARPVGVLTRGTTGPDRLRRVDRWLLGTWSRLLVAVDDPLVVDLGYGASPVTTVELAARLRRVRPDVDVVGLEIDPERVARAQAYAAPGLDFRLGGFELPLGGRRPVVVRAMNVLRQYSEPDAADAWRVLRRGLAPGGVLIEGTCDELGRRATWVTLDVTGPLTLTFASRLGSLDRPGSLAERLPKALIHHNVPGEPIAALLADLDRCWDSASAYAPLGVRQRWVRTVQLFAERGWDVRDRAPRWRLGELTVGWSDVKPNP